MKRKEKRKMAEKGNGTGKETNLKFVEKNVSFVSRWDISDSSLNNKRNMA